MTDREACDALVIGGGVNGLVAAAYLARAGKRTLLLEPGQSAGGLCRAVDMGNGFLAPMAAHTLYALDPRVTTELKLTRHGLKFAVRDAPTVLLRDGDEHLVATRDIRTTARNISVISKADAEAWPQYQRELFACGRHMRALWWEEEKAFTPDDTIERLTRTGTGAWLDSWFESDALKAMLAFDASALSSIETGSSLLLAWRAAQEMCGLQAATAFPAGGPAMLVQALLEACKIAGVDIGTGACVEELTVKDGRVTGAYLRSGEAVSASLVLSSLSRRKTLLELANGEALGLAECRTLQNAPAPLAAAKVLLAFDQLPFTGGAAEKMSGRAIVADRLESYAFAHAAARAGRIPEEPVMEIVFPADPSFATSGNHVASIMVRPVPYDVAGGWGAHKTAFAAAVVARLNQRIPGLAKRVTGAKVFTPKDLSANGNAPPDAVSASRMLASWSRRMQTSIDGLFLCGEDAEPVPAVSGRAGRIAAALAMKAAAAS